MYKQTDSKLLHMPHQQETQVENINDNDENNWKFKWEKNSSTPKDI